MFIYTDFRLQRYYELQKNNSNWIENIDRGLERYYPNSTVSKLQKIRRLPIAEKGRREGFLKRCIPIHQTVYAFVLKKVKGS